MKYRALLLDIDGTVVGKDYVISPMVKEAIGKAKKKLLVSLCSQRQYPAFGHYVEELRLTTAQIACGGAQIVDDDGKELWGKRINPEVVKMIYQGLRWRGKIVFLNDDKFVYEDGRVDEYEGYPVPIRPIEAVEDWGEILQIGADGVTEDDWQWIEKQSGIHAVRVFSRQMKSESYTSITAEGVSKQRGIVEYCRINKIKPEEVIAVGDDLNDYPMLMAAGLKIAMATAPEELRAMADFVCPSVDEDGVAVVIDKFIL